MPAAASDVLGFWGLARIHCGLHVEYADMDLFRVAVVQAGSVPFDRERSTVKALDLTGQAIRSGARLIVFPEAFISGYPKGADFGTRVGMRSPEGRKWFRSACGRRCYLHLIKGHDTSLVGYRERGSPPNRTVTLRARTSALFRTSPSAG